MDFDTSHESLLQGNGRLGDFPEGAVPSVDEGNLSSMARRPLTTPEMKLMHALKNKLMPICGLSEVLLLNFPQALEDKEKAKYYLELIHAAAGEAMKFAQRFHPLYRETDDQPLQRVDLNSLVAETIRSTRGKWKDESLARGIVIDVVYQPQEAPPISGRKNELREALVNLIYNAVDAMPQGGQITISTFANDEHAFLRVKDTGIGMTEEVKRRCFNPLFSTKKKAGGFGIGLAVVAETVCKHHGQISVESEPGAGATFTIMLPLCYVATLR